MTDMEISDRGLMLIEGFEAFSPIPYIDVAGHESIAFGHKIRPDEEFTSVTEQQAEDILKQDVKFAESAICQCVNVDLNQNQYDALTSLVFNIGGGAFIKSTLLEKLNDSDFEGAAEEFTQWIHAGGQISKGLINRRKTEQALFTLTM